MSAREFEKQAAMHFFRTVMRPTDEAAIYSIESESYLAQPLTRDVGLLRANDRKFWQTGRIHFALRCDH